MSYADDPVTYSTNAQGQTVATWTGGPNPGTFVYEQDQPNGNYGWDKIVTATPTGPIAPPAPTPVAPHLQFSNATIGSNIFLMYGDCRLPGQIAWAPGIDATNNVLDTSFLTFMTVYGEPLDPSESVEIASMSANGTTFYQSGGVVTVDNLSADAQAALATSVATMAVYTGSETQLPDPTMEDYLGVGNVPAYRGLRYIVFQDFPIEITNGAVPNIIVEWRRTGGLLNVSDVMAKLINRVNWRSQYAQSRATIFFGAPTIDGIDDLCQGIQVTSQSSLLDHLNNHRNLYNFQIKEENPVKVVRRAVASDLVIDISVNEADLAVDSGAPALTTNRANPADFPVGLNLSYCDPDHAFDIKVAPAVFDGTAPGRSTATSSAILTAQMDYVVDATTARTIAYNAMFDLRSYAARAQLVLKDLRAEVGDVVAVTTANGDEYVLLVNQQTITKTRSNAMQCLQLLSAAGGDVNGDGGNDGGSATRLHWPDEVTRQDIIATADKIYTTCDSLGTVISFNLRDTPLRKVTKSKWRNLGQIDPNGLNWGGDAFYLEIGGPGRFFEDAFYVYLIHMTTLVISRILKTATNINQIETITIAEGFYIDGNSLHDNSNLAGNVISELRDGIIYIGWLGIFNGDGNQNGMRLVTFDVTSWTTSAWTVNDFETALTGGLPWQPQGIAVTDNGHVIIAAANGSSAQRYYHAALTDLTSWSHADASFTTRQGSFVRSGNVLYLPEVEIGSFGRPANKSRIAVVDMTSGSPSESVVDLALKDSNWECNSQEGMNIMAASATHLFVYGNHSNGINTNPTAPQQHRYIGRFDLATLDAAGGKFLSELLYNENDFAILRMCIGPDNKLYSFASPFAINRSSILVTSEDLTVQNFYWSSDRPMPVNDNFASPALLVADVSQFGDLSYASTEPNEPVPGWHPFVTGASNDTITYFNNGHSVWYLFVAPATHTYTIAVENADNFDTGGLFDIAIYQGDALDAVTYVTGLSKSGAIGKVTSCSLSATEGESYRICVTQFVTADAFGGAIPTWDVNQGKFLIEAIT